MGYVSRPEWEHLEALVKALTAAGNLVVSGGFRPSQGGMYCEMRDRLDPDVLASWVSRDDRLSYDVAADELSCRHCWASIFGADAVARRRTAHQASTAAHPHDDL
jgi:hypothetical protein